MEIKKLKISPFGFEIVCLVSTLLKAVPDDAQHCFLSHAALLPSHFPAINRHVTLKLITNSGKTLQNTTYDICGVIIVCESGFYFHL